jgi:hypothetical protein
MEETKCLVMKEARERGDGGKVALFRCFSLETKKVGRTKNIFPKKNFLALRKEE